MYLARHVRFGAHMSMDTLTTLPVESMNNIVKKNVNSNYNLRKSIKTTTGVIDERFEDHRKSSLREENIVNHASKSVTKDIIKRKAQYLIDQSFDNRLNIKGINYRQEVWLCWYFREVNAHSKKKGSWKELWDILPSYHNVYTIEVVRSGDHLSLNCKCEHFEE